MQPRRLRPSLFGRGVDRPVEGRARSLFFNGAWIYGSAALLVVGMASGNQALTLLALFVLVTAGLARVWNHFSLTRVSYTRTLSATRALPDDTVTLTLTLVNRKLLPLPWLAIEDELSDGVRVLDREATPSGTPGRQTIRIFTGVRPYERVNWRIALHCPARGMHNFGPATLRSGDLFGFFNNRLSVASEDQLLVYPRVVSLKDLGLPPRRPFGETRVVRHLLTDPTRVVGVRDYRPEDPFRAIHWKATARQGNLQVRVYEPTTMLQFGIFVNLDTFDHYWEGLDIELSEIAIVIAASIASWADQQRYAVGVYANGLVHASDQALRVPPGRATGQLTEILEGLAKVTPYSTLNFARTLRLEAVRFPWGSTIVIITSQLSDTLTGLLAGLIAAGQAVVLIPIGECPIPSLRGLIVRRIDETALRSGVGSRSPRSATQRVPGLGGRREGDDVVLLPGLGGRGGRPAATPDVQVAR